MKITRTVGKVVKPFVDVPTWVGYKQLAETSKSIGSILKTLFVPAKAERQETFEEALVRLNLTEQDIAQRKKEFTRLLFFYTGLAIVIFLYAIYLAFAHSIHGSIAAFAVTLIALAMVFRYHFWLFQIKQRRLGCSFKEWLNSGFIGDKQ